MISPFLISDGKMADEGMILTTLKRYLPIWQAPIAHETEIKVKELYQ